MPAQDEKLRRALRDATRKNRDFGNGNAQRFPVHPLGSDDGSLRENGRFYDQTGRPVIGFMVIGGFNT